MILLKDMWIFKIAHYIQLRVFLLIKFKKLGNGRNLVMFFFLSQYGLKKSSILKEICYSF